MQYKSATGIDYVSAATPLPVTLSGTISPTITDDTTTNATMYPTWVTAATGNLPLKVTSTKLTYNPSTGAFSTGTGSITGGAISGTTGAFSGLLSGTKTTATQFQATGWNASSGANAANGQIDVGTTSVGLRLIGDAAGSGGAYIDSTWDNAGSFIQFRLRGSGTPVVGATLTTTGLNSTVIGATTPAAGSFTTLIAATSTPASAAASGTAGTITWDASYIYVCTATNTWKRVAIATW